MINVVAGGSIPLHGVAGLSRIVVVRRWRAQSGGSRGDPSSRHAAPTLETVVALEGFPEWKLWVNGFSLPCRLGLSDTIEQSLVDYHKERGYREPPKR